MEHTIHPVRHMDVGGDEEFVKTARPLDGRQYLSVALGRTRLQTIVISWR